MFASEGVGEDRLLVRSGLRDGRQSQSYGGGTLVGLVGWGQLRDTPTCWSGVPASGQGRDRTVATRILNPDRDSGQALPMMAATRPVK